MSNEVRVMIKSREPFCLTIHGGESALENRVKIRSRKKGSDIYYY